MFLKSLGLLPLLIGGFYVAGVFDGSGYVNFARHVERPPAEVMDALADLDIRTQPGSPGTDPSRSGGVKPVFLLERRADRMIWTVMSRDKVAIRMTAVVKGARGGSRVTAFVERGDAPDELTSPAFRSTGITMGLFGSALDDELGELTMAAAADPAVCDAMFERFEMENMAAFGSEPSSLGQAMGATAGIARKLREQEAELRRAGCEPWAKQDPDAWPTDEMSKGGGKTAMDRPDPATFDNSDPSRIDPSVTDIPADVR